VPNSPLFETKAENLSITVTNMDIHKRRKPELTEAKATSTDGEVHQSSEEQAEADSDAQELQQSINASVNTPQRVRSKRKRVKLALNDWNQLPTYLKDNE